MHKISDKIMAWLPKEEIEEEALQQLFNIAKMPWVQGHIAVMPDCHCGKGATVGSVIPSKGAISPATVGVDIGCGMIAVLTKFTAKDLPDNLKAVREGIERRIPVSAGGYNQKLTQSAEQKLKGLETLAKKDYFDIDAKWTMQLGTLGSGNHFIELCLDETDRLWAVLHSGSRGIGNRLGSQHIKIAQAISEARGDVLPDRDLAYFLEGTAEFKDYINDVLWAQKFAFENRNEMMDRVLTELSYVFYKEDGHQKEIELERINCHHNFTQLETHMGQEIWLTRKGAIQMKQGQLGVIPGSMGTNSYIVSGLQNEMAFHSAPHGAGRRMSRTKAKAQFTLEDLKNSMYGIEFNLSPAFIDEIPGAYKDVKTVMEQSKDLVEIKHELRQILNVKGN